MTAPTVFISYSHDSTDHKKWVLELATDLPSNGVDATLDQWDLAPGHDVSLFMQKGIADADRVLLVCSGSYVEKADRGAGGVGYERLIVTEEMVASIDTKKFVPIIRNGMSGKKLPKFLGPRRWIDFEKDGVYDETLQELRELLGASSKPPLGANPFSGEAIDTGVSARIAGPTGVTVGGERLLDDEWYEEEQVTALNGIAKLGLSGHMELRFGLHEDVSKSQIDLLNAVEESEIKTFGWPIGITLQNVDQYRPRPFANGIRTEVSIPDGKMSGKPSYDYWALRSNGDFFLLQDLFEDEREEKKIFFNTRIVRVTEALLFCKNLYQKLGAPPGALLSVRVEHGGLEGRTLTSSSHNRFFRGSGTVTESTSRSDVVVALGRIGEELVDHVERLLAPLFMLFDFQTFDKTVYEDIVRRFERGEVS